MNNEEQKDKRLNSKNPNIIYLRHSQKIKSNLENTKQILLRNSWEPQISILKNQEINNKFFPSKQFLCKGTSSNNINSYNFSSNSPIVQYYASGIDTLNNSNNENNNLTEQNFNIFKRGSGYSNSSFQNFNFSPSNIFNQNTLNNSFFNNNSNRNSGKIKKSIQEKFEFDDNFVIDCDENEENEEFKNKTQEKIDNSNNKEFLTLSFNSDDDNNNLYEDVSGDDNDKNFKNNSDNNNNDPNLISNLRNNLRNGFHMSMSNTINKRIEETNNNNDSENNINNMNNNNNNDINNNINSNNNNINNYIYNNFDNNVNSNEKLNEKKNVTEENFIKKENINDNTINNNNININNIIKNYINNDININYTNTNINHFHNIPKYYQNNVIQQNYYLNYNNNYSQENLNNIYLRRNPNEFNEKNKFNNIFTSKSEKKPNFQNKYENLLNKNNPNIIINNNINYNNQISNNINFNSINIPKPNFFSEQKKSKKIKRLDASEYINVPLNILSNKFYNLAKDQKACRYLQKLLEDNPEETLKYLYKPLINNILKLINDSFGNYLIQKMFIPMDENQIKEIIYILSPHIYDIGCNSHGTRVLQALIKKLTNEYLQKLFLNLIIPQIIPLLKELNGTHVVQKFAEFYPQYNNYINNIIIENSSILATHRHGCCVIQKYFEILDFESKNKLILNLISNCLILVGDQFGNYVIQTILLMDNMIYGNLIVEKILPNVCYYSKHKYSSNVVEKTFEHCDGETKKKLIEVILKPENLNDLMLDEHGNYIVQKVISVCNEDEKKYIFKNINKMYFNLKNLHFGEKVIYKLISQYPNYINDEKKV